VAATARWEAESEEADDTRKGEMEKGGRAAAGGERMDRR